MIRQFKNSDLTEVMTLWLDGNMQAHSFIDGTYWQRNYSFVSEMILKAEVYVYEEKGVVVGFVGMDGDYIAGIFVQRDRQSCGIGKKLLDFLKIKFSVLNLNVYQKNSRALAFYLKEGFKLVGENFDKNTREQELSLRWLDN